MNLLVKPDLGFGTRTVAPTSTPPPPKRRLKLCLITETLVTGVGRHVTDVATGMATRGHEVHLLHSMARCDDRLLREIKRRPEIRCRALPMRRAPHRSDLRNLMEMTRYLRAQGRFDVIHGHSSKGGAYARLLGILISGKRLYTPHAFVTMARDLPGFQRSVYTLFERSMALCTDTIICVSEGERQHGLRLAINADRLTVVPSGVRARDAAAPPYPRTRLGLPKDTVIIGFVGRLDHQKAPQRLVDAICLLEPDKPFHVIMVGDGPLREELELRTRQLGIADRFSWCGDTPSAPWLDMFDILAMPSLYEGFSYVLLEALSAGVPVVCTRVGGVQEAIEHGVNGYVVRQGETRTFAARLSSLIDDPGLRRAMSRHAHARSARFSCEAMLDRLEEIYLGRPVEIPGTEACGA